MRRMIDSLHRYHLQNKYSMYSKRDQLDQFANNLKLHLIIHRFNYELVNLWLKFSKKTD